MDRVWYFAYGSNMQSATLAGRRGIAPTVAVAARAPGWRLVLDKPPLVPMDQSFANLVPDPNAETFGVLYEIGADDMAHVELTEGVPVDNYRRVEIDAVPLAPARTPAPMRSQSTASPPTSAQPPATPGPVVSASPPIRALTLVSDKHASGLRPSARYMALLIEGAEEHDLPAEWIAFLRSLPTAQESARAIAARALIDDVLARVRR